MSSSTNKRSSPMKPSETAENLPPQRHLTSLRKVSPPFYKTRLSNLIYVLVGLTTLLTVFYSYRAMQYKTATGGWWSLILGKRPPEMQASGAPSPASGEHANTGDPGSGTVESHIMALALALGMPTHELAAAIASAVRAYVPPASLSSIKAHETGDAVKVLLQEPVTATEGGQSAWDPASTAAGVVEGVVSGMENFVGMDEP